MSDIKEKKRKEKKQEKEFFWSQIERGTFRL